jgi:hypothetical protein
MIIRSVRHRGLLRFIQHDDSRELRTDLVRRLRNILAVLIAAILAADVVGYARLTSADEEGTHLRLAARGYRAEGPPISRPRRQEHR